MNNIKEAIEYRAAGARWEREEAYTLLQQSNPSAESNAAARRKIFFNDFMAGPDAITFIAVRRGKVIGTMSLFMDGNIGLLGADYPGYFPVGDTRALARLLRRIEGDPSFVRELARAVSRRRVLFQPARETAAWRRLLASLEFH